MNQIETGSYTELALPLTNSRGLGKFIRFDYQVPGGPEMPLVVSPHILGLGTPYYTRQALYFLSNVECVIRVMMYQPASMEHREEEWSEESLSKFRKAADDCLFEYSLRYPNSRLTTHPEYSALSMYSQQRIYRKVRDESGNGLKYLEVDGGRALLLAPAVPELFEQMYSAFLSQIYSRDIDASEVEKEYNLWLEDPVGIDPSPAVQFQEVPYTFDELALISRVMPLDTEVWKPTGQSVDQVEPERTAREWLLSLFVQPDVDRLRELPHAKWPDQEIVIVSNTYSSVLLDFYFAGLRSLSPIVEFRNYYNIIEFLFEDATFENAMQQLREKLENLKSAKDFSEYAKYAEAIQLPNKETEQIREVVKRYICPERIEAFLGKELSNDAREYFETYNQSASGKEVRRLKPGKLDLDLIADRIYQFRNAIFHAKRTLKGRKIGHFRPFSKEETEVIRYEALLLRFVAQEIIKQGDPELV